MALSAALCTACGDDPDETDADAGSTAADCDPTPVELTGDAARFDLGDLAVPTGSFSEDGYLVINARSDHAISDLVIEFADVVAAAGFDQAGSEDEGFEGEVFFSRGDVAAGLVKFTESDCPGLVDVKISVLDDPAVLPTG